MRLLYLVDHWPGLFEAYLFREMQWMRLRGHSIAVFSLARGGPHGFRAETKDYIDLTEFDLQDIPALQLDSRNMTESQVERESISFVQKHGVELIDAHLAREPAEIAYRIHRVTGIPFTVRMRGGDVHSNTSPKLSQILEYASAVCPMSGFLADVLVGNRLPKKVPQGIPAKVNPGKLHVVPNSLPAKYLSRTPVAQSDEQQVIGAIGRAVPVKRFEDLIEAAARLVPQFPGLQVKIVGGGIMMPDLQALASRLGLADRVEITGFKRWNEVMALAKQFHIYVQASELEGCSLANIEAAFQGMPLVLSRTGANEQCVEQGVNGYLFHPGDVTALCETLRALLLAGARKREQMGNATLSIVGSRFSAESIMPLLEMLFQDAIDGSKRGQRSLSLAGAVSGGDSNG